MQDGAGVRRREMMKSIEDRPQSREPCRHRARVDGFRDECDALMRCGGDRFERSDVRIQIGERCGDGHALPRKTLDQQRHRARSTGTQVNDPVRSALAQRSLNQRQQRPLELQRSLHEVQVVGRKIANDSRKPRLIFQLEEVDSL